MAEERTRPENAKPTVIREAATTTLNNWFKTWLDLKTFLKQRRQLLDDPKVALTGPSQPDTSWKSPFAFATQGLLLTTVMIQLLASAFGLFVVKPESYIKRLRDRNRQVAQAAKSNLAVAEQADDETVFKSEIFPKLDDWLKKPEAADTSGPIVFGITKQNYVITMKKLIAQTEDIPKQLDYAEKLSAAEALFAKILVPLSLVFAAVFFRLLFYRIKEVRAIADKEQVMQAYLYIVTARLFWTNAVLSVIYALLHYSFIYSGFYDRTLFDSVSRGDPGMTQFLFVQAEITLPVIVCLPLVLYSFHKMSISLRKLFNLPPPSIWFDRVGSYVRVANFLSTVVLFVLLFICSWGYARLLTAWEKHKINFVTIENKGS